MYCAYKIPEEQYTSQQYYALFQCRKCHVLKNQAKNLTPAEMKLIMNGIMKLILFQTHVIEETLYKYNIPLDISNIISNYAIEESSIEF